MSVCHYTGVLRQGADDLRWSLDETALLSLVKSYLTARECRLVVGSLASGSDLLVASAALELRIPLIAFLPCDIDQFIESSVSCGGPEEVERFRSILTHLQELHVLPVALAPNAEIGYLKTSELAMYTVRGKATQLGVQPWQMAIWDGRRMDSHGTGADMANWQATGNPSQIILLPSLETRETLPLPDELKEAPLLETKLGYEWQQAWSAACYDLPEASVMHCCRLQEGLIFRACQLTRLKLDRLENYFAINELSAARQLNRPAFLVAQQLRHIGNAVRHIQRPLGRGEHLICLSLVRRLLVWYASEFWAGPQLLRTSIGLPVTPHDELIETLVEVIDPQFLQMHEQGILKMAEVAPAITLLACERAIDLKCWTVAESCLDRLRSVVFLRRRLLELRALMHSRRGEPEQAVRILGSIPLRDFDIETPGILAGAHKRLWLRSRERWQLEKACKLYSLAWTKTGDTYVGINAAACASWVGNPTVGQKIALKIIKRLTRLSQHWPRSSDQSAAWDFWSLATMSEALWIAGQREEAVVWEEQAISVGTQSGSPVEVFSQQMQLHRKHAQAE